MSCYEIQKLIQEQQTISKILDGEIDAHQSGTTGLLKQAIVQKHFHCQRAFVTEAFLEKKIRDPLQHSSFTASEKEISQNFASLLLPDTFSKGPMKAFLNTVLDSLDEFLPMFYKMTPSKLPKGQMISDPCAFLVRCVFPSLFSFCVTSESAHAYARNLVTWCRELAQENADFMRNFDKHWMFNAMRGLFENLNLQSFIQTTVTPIFFKVVGYGPGEVDQNPALLLSLANELVESCKKNYHLLPEVLNVFYNEIFQVLPEQDTPSIVFALFYEIMIAPCFKSPMLSSTCNITIPVVDYSSFHMIYDLIRLKFGRSASPEAENLVKNLPEFDVFDPMSILGTIRCGEAKEVLPKLQEFCDIVQCAHQPLLFTTHNIAILFRFVASLQHACDNLLPKSIDKSISKVFQESLADQLEILPDLLFWFPCYSLTYLKMSPPCLCNTTSSSSLYRLLSSPVVVIPPGMSDLAASLEASRSSVNITTHPELRTEIQWLLDNHRSDGEKLISDVKAEIEKMNALLDKKRDRSMRLDSYGRLLEGQMQSIPKGPERAMANALLESFRTIYPGEMIAPEFLDELYERTRSFTGKAFLTVGGFLIQSVFVEAFPYWRTGPAPQYSAENDEADVEVKIMRSMVSGPMACSSVFSIADRFATDAAILIAYGKIAGIENPLKVVYASPFCERPGKLAMHFSNFVTAVPRRALQLVFTRERLDALENFIKVFT